MKEIKHLLFFPLYCYLLFACTPIQSNNAIGVNYSELRTSEAEEFSKNYKTHPIRLMNRFSAYRDFYQTVKNFPKKDSEITALKDRALKIYSEIGISNPFVIKHLNKLNSLLNDSSAFTNSLSFIDYLILNDLNKSVYKDDFQFERVDLKAHLTKIGKDSAELVISPVAGFKYYLPIAYINGDTIRTRLKNNGSLIIRESIVGKDEIQIKGNYVIKNHTSKVELPIDTILKLDN